MTFATVAVKNLRRHGLRNVLTVLGVAIAMVAFMLLRTVLSAWTMGAEYAAKDRIATRHKVTFVMSLPYKYVQQIADTEGITASTFMSWFGARVVGKEDMFFANIATDPERFMRVYDEVVLPDAQRKAWLSNRKGAIVGKMLARQMGWKVGDRVTLQGSIYPGQWDFDIEGIYSTNRRSMDQNSFFFHWKYLNERAIDVQKDRVGWVVSRIRNASDAAAIAKRIDARFDVQDIQTLSMSERALNASVLGMLATLLKALNISSLVILTIMMLVLGNTIAMGVRERTREYGVLRAVGFLPKHLVGLVMGEALVIGLVGGALGVGISVILIDGAMGPFMEDNFSAWFPYFAAQPRDVLTALALSAAGALVAAVLPAQAASRLVVSDALRRVG